jgi:hypothetical protein
MDSSTKQRYISTSIWSDEWFDTLSIQEKLIYFHLLTNEFTNAAGVYHFSLKQIRIDLDISRDEVNAAMEKFAAAGKAFYFQEYIIIPKWLKHQKISDRSKMFLGALSILRGLPDEIKRFIADRSHYDFPVEKYVQIPSIDRLCPVEDSLCLKKDSLSENGGKNGIGYAQNAANSAHDIDSDIDSDSDSDIDLDNNNISANLSSREENPPGDNPGPSGAVSSSLLDFIKTESKAAGFSIPGKLARHLVNTVNPGWLSGPFSYFRFVVIMLRDEYGEKPRGEMEKLYLAALWKGWESYLDGYPAWREQREAAAAEEEKRRTLRESRPAVCRCGAALSSHLQCPKCGGFYQPDKQTGGFVFIPPPDVTAEVKLFQDKIRAQQVPKGSPDNLDI